MMTTQAETIEAPYTQPMVDCLAAQRRLVEEALALSARLARKSCDEADQVRLGAACIQIAADHALAARDERTAIRYWAQCELGDRQLRSATARALRKGWIETYDYDELFDAAIRATRIRREEMLRLRRRLQLLAVI